MKNMQKHHHSLLYVKDSSECTEFFDGLLFVAQSLGFQHCWYGMGVPGQSGKAYRLFSVNNLSLAWQEQYRIRGYQCIDPTLSHAMHKSEALVWCAELFAGNFGLSGLMRSVGFNHGWTQPVREPDGKFGVLTLARSEGTITAGELQEKEPMLRWLVRLAHTVLFPILLAKQEYPLVLALTSREIQLLQLTAQGKTASDISEILGITDRTANFHIGNAMEKLGAANKTEAVVRAMKLGLLD